MFMKIDVCRASSLPELISHCDKYDEFLIDTLIPSVLESLKEPALDSHLAQPELLGPDVEMCDVSTLGGLVSKNLEADPSTGEFPFTQWAKLKFLQSCFVFPMTDVWLSRVK